nr:MAG TPA: hypothetical protein [Caudoviricetes sp.]
MSKRYLSDDPYVIALVVLCVVFALIAVIVADYLNIQQHIECLELLKAKSATLWADIFNITH